MMNWQMMMSNCGQQAGVPVPYCSLVATFANTQILFNSWMSRDDGGFILAIVLIHVAAFVVSYLNHIVLPSLTLIQKTEAAYNFKTS